MAQRDPDQLTEFLQAEVGDELRSVIHYDENTFELVYARDDVAEQYTESDLENVRQDLGVASFGKPVLEDLYVHGDLQCTVHCFENAIEMMFLVSETEGIAVGLDPAAFVTHRTFIGRCLEEAGYDYK